MKKIAIFASGSGSNAENLIEHFRSNNSIEVSLIVTNRRKAKVVERASRLKVPALIITRDMFYDSNNLVKILDSLNIDLIVLAGFLWKIPENLIKSFPNKIINLHPSLLPKYGGKGMYGSHVHEAVISNGEKSTGITIHYVNEEYDKGAIIKQVEFELDSNETLDSLQAKIHDLEFKYLPAVITEILN